MAPFAFPHKTDDGVDEVMELQNAASAHYSPSIANLQPISIFESINSVLHATKSTDTGNNGSQTGSGNGLLNSPTGQGESEDESDLAVLLALFIPLAATVTVIFIIALFVRRMRRAESMHEVQRTHTLNEFPMTPRKKISATNSTSSTMSSASSIVSQRSPTSGDAKSFSRSSSTNNSNNSHQQLDAFSSSGSIYCNSSYLRLSGHNLLQHQSSLPVPGVSHSPSGTPWPLTQESGSLYYPSIYGLNKLHQQLYQQASLQAFSSIQSLNGLPLTRQYSDPQTYCTQSDPELEMSSDEGGSTNTIKKSPSKKFKRVLSAMNFPRKIRQYQADRKRFNIYTIPVETREQLKHIYVY